MQLKLTKTEGVFSREERHDRLITSPAKGSWSRRLYARTNAFSLVGLVQQTPTFNSLRNLSLINSKFVMHNNQSASAARSRRRIARGCIVFDKILRIIFRIAAFKCVYVKNPSFINHFCDARRFLYTKIHSCIR